MVFDKVGSREEGRHRWKVVSFADSGGAEAEAEQEETSDLRREVGTDY